MKKTLLISGLLSAFILGGIFTYTYMTRYSETGGTNTAENILEKPIHVLGQRGDYQVLDVSAHNGTYAVRTIASTKENIVIGVYIAGSDGSTSLYLVSRETNDAVLLGLVDNIEKAVLTSPDKAHIAIITEKEITVLKTSDLSYRVVYTAKTGTMPGTLSGFPSFIPKVKWSSFTTLEVRVYATDSPYDDGTNTITPLETKTVSL